VVADIGDPTGALALDDGLVRRAPREIVLPDELHVALVVGIRVEGYRERK